jgi:hypothetical protein
VGLPVGLLVGGVESEATIINSFYTASDTVSSVGIGRVFGDAGTVECERVAAVGTALFGRGDAPLKSWDFARTWGMEANAGATAYPRLREPAAGGLTAPK